MNNQHFKSINIGNVTIKGNLFLAPLAGFTDKAFRSICIDHGASFTYSEMVSAEALARKSEKTKKLTERAENEKLLGIQIFLPDADTAKRAIPELLRTNPTVIDINCGCPVPKVVKNGAGSALMRTPEVAKEIIKTITGETDIPVTVKFRTGWDLDSINYLHFAESAIKGGASLLTMHGRTRSQGYSGEADWESIKNLKSNFDVPVVGSGNIFSAEDAVKMMETTGVDGVLFARGAMGNPFIFERTKNLLLGNESPPIDSMDIKIQTAWEHISKAVHYKGEQTACREIKKQLCSYTKGEKGSAALRNKIVRAETLKDYKEIFEEYLSL
ncbi:MAG: tRNA dihydrouridine synthase DusB [Spirochaetia bacterium]|jgi:tRNA-dihydrouridine synthase B|nr:tRNA dihydrouridine synthase DusB [Spirochaetia bacterium]